MNAQNPNGEGMTIGPLRRLVPPIRCGYLRSPGKSAVAADLAGAVHDAVGHFESGARFGAMRFWTDTIPGVMHQRGKRSSKTASPELVNNSAAGDSASGPTPARRATRLSWTSPARVRRRSPVSALADALKAERTSPPEGSCISSPGSRRPAPVRAARHMNENWPMHAYFAALDWASDHHDVIVLDRQGAVALEFRFAHSPAGWAEFDQKMQPYRGAPFTLETASGPAVDQLLHRGWSLYPVAPVAAADYRKRKAPSGAKTDRHDTWALADALRSDGHAWRPLLPQDEATATLRLLCRDEIALIEQRTLLVNQLQATLREYYPGGPECLRGLDRTLHLELCASSFPPRWNCKMPAGASGKSSCTPASCGGPKPGRNVWRSSPSANALPASAPVVSAKRLLALSLVKLLQTLQRQIDEYRAQITQAFRQHPDHDIFGGLPGAKEILAPRLLAELGAVRRNIPMPKP